MKTRKQQHASSRQVIERKRTGHRPKSGLWLTTLGGVVTAGMTPTSQVGAQTDLAVAQASGPLDAAEIQAIIQQAVMRDRAQIVDAIRGGGADVSIVPDKLEKNKVGQFVSSLGHSDPSKAAMLKALYQVRGFLELLIHSGSGADQNHVDLELTPGTESEFWSHKQTRESWLKHQERQVRGQTLALTTVARKMFDEIERAGFYDATVAGKNRGTIKQATRDLFSLAFTEPPEILRELQELGRGRVDILGSKPNYCHREDLTKLPDDVSNANMSDCEIKPMESSVITTLLTIRDNSTRLLCGLLGSEYADNSGYHACNVKDEFKIP